MEQIKNFVWAQDKIDELTGIIRNERHGEQQYFQQDRTGENRAQRRERERQERRTTKKVRL